MGLIDRLLTRPKQTAPDGGTGIVRLGGSSWSARWNFARTLNSVYANPTGKRCVERLANDFQRPDWQLRDRGTQDDIPGDEAAYQDAYNVLRRPRANMSATQMQYHISRDLDLAGGTHWLKVRGEQDDIFGDRAPVTGLRRLAPQRITVIADDDDELLGFIYRDRMGRFAPVLIEDTVYAHYPHPERPADRLAPAIVAGLPAETDTAAMQFNFELLNNDSALPGYLAIENLTPTQFNEWAAMWEAGEQPGKTRFLGGNNAKYVQVGQSNKDLMYDKLRDASREDICRAFGVARVLIDPTDATFANMDIASRNHIKSSVHPRWVMVADAFTLQLGPDLGDGIEIGFKLDDIEELQEGLDSMVDRNIKLLDKAVMTINEARKDLGLDDVPWGDVPIQNIAPMALPAASTDNTQRDLDVIDAKAITALETELKEIMGTDGKSPDVPGFDGHVNRAEKRAQRAMEKFFDRQAKAIEKRIASKKGRTKAVDDWWDGERWNDELTEVTAPLLSDTVDAIGSAALAAFNDQADLDAAASEITTYLETRSVEIAQLVNSTTEEEVRAVIATGVNSGQTVAEIARDVRQYFTDAKTMRAERVARTEIIGAANFGAIEGARQSGVVTGKTWLAASDAEEDCVAVNGITVPLDASFGPADQPPLHPNCRCTVTFTTEEIA